MQAEICQGDKAVHEDKELQGVFLLGSVGVFETVHDTVT